MKVYEYTDDSWYDGHEDCPCCSGMWFECYNAVGWNQNGSACDIHELYSQIILNDIVEGETEYLPCFNPYESFTLQELKEVLKRRGIVVRELSGSITDYIKE